MSTTAIGVVEAFGCQIQNLEYNALLAKSSCFEEFLVFHQVYEARWGGRPRWLTFFSSLIWTWHGWVMLMYKTHVLADLLHACQFQHPFCVQSPFSACLDHGFWAFFKMNMKKRVHWGLLVDLSLRLGSPRGKKRILMLQSRFTFEHASFFFHWPTFIIFLIPFDPFDLIFQLLSDTEWLSEHNRRKEKEMKKSEQISNTSVYCNLISQKKNTLQFW